MVDNALVGTANSIQYQIVLGNTTIVNSGITPSMHPH